MVNMKITLLFGEQLYRTHTITITPDISYVSLQDRIERFFGVKPLHQQIYFRGEELSVVEHPLQTVENDEEITIKHCSLEHWEAFKHHSQKARQAKNSKAMVGEHVQLAIFHNDLLRKNYFFNLSSEMFKMANDFLHDFALYKDSQFEPITYASNSYFSTLYQIDPECATFNIEWKPKRGPIAVKGTVRCYVYREETLLMTYHVRTHTKLAEQHDNKSADLRVLFMYKLLEILRFGPKVHFYRNTGLPGFGFYTASEEVPGFRSFFGLSNSRTFTEIQMRLLCYCFYLRDVFNDKKNFGVDSNGRLQIVHFELRSHIPNAERQATMYCHHYQNEETRIGQACLAKWNLLSCIDMADEAIEKEKKLFEDHSFTFDPERDYSEYLTKIKSNVRYFTALFDRLEPPLSLAARCLRLVDPKQINFRLGHNH
ncbi:unnamed protein product [Auanema sp. JU1783]|nr:unnamed protein product [Auanema sp. JU1783]